MSSRGINKVILVGEYAAGKSIPELSREFDMSRSTVRQRLLEAGVLRTRKDALRIAGENGKLGGGLRGKKRVFTDAHKNNIAIARTGTGRGFSIKPNGYVELTTGADKGRLEHVVVMEKSIGRRIAVNECVHHLNHIKSDNRLENLQLMTKADHSSLHASENHINRKRTAEGAFA